MPQVKPCDDIAAWKASYLAQRFGLSIEEAKRFKRGEALSLSGAEAEKIVAERFGEITGEDESVTVMIPVEESEEVTDVSN